jgi:transcriptional regulator with XRE-family HTH domain
MLKASTTDQLVSALAGHVGIRIREERRRRRWTLRDLSLRAGISTSLLHWIETGRAASLESYVRISAALGLRTALELVDSRRRDSARPQDPVHAAIVELLASRVARPRVTVSVDEPYQHYQFAGRADLVAWSVEERALLHVKVRTAFPNLQDAFGSYNAKRRWLAASVADRIGLHRGFDIVTHAMVALWSSEVVHAVRLHPESFRAIGPDPADPFEAWWHGVLPPRAATSSLVFVDPVEGGRRDRRRLVGLDDALRTRPRFRGYADVVAALEGRVARGPQAERE